MTGDELFAPRSYVTPGEIRAMYAEAIARGVYEKQRSKSVSPASVPRWTDTDIGMPDIRDHYRRIVEHLVDALAEDGLLPVGDAYRDVRTPAGDSLGYRERHLVTDWREAPAPCTGCGVTERKCAENRAAAPITAHCSNREETARQKAAAKCCPDCRHPLRKVDSE